MKKLLAIVLVILLILNLALFILGYVGELIFWSLIILGALASYLMKRFS